MSQPISHDDENTHPQAPLLAEQGPTFASSEAEVTDLSKEIIKQLPCAAGERVTCRWITGNHYRCNWWSPQGGSSFENPGMAGLTVTTHRVSKSRLYCVTRSAEGLSIDPVTRR